MYNLLEYSDNYQNLQEVFINLKKSKFHQIILILVKIIQLTSFKYKSELLENQVNNVKIAVPLKYISNFFRSLEMPLINCKISSELTWTKDCVLSNDAGDGGDLSFKIKKYSALCPYCYFIY